MHLIIVVYQFLVRVLPKLRPSACAGLLPLHIAVRRQAPEVVKLLMACYPQGVAQRDVDGRLPLHFAVKSATTPVHEPILLSLLSQNPAGAAIRDNKGWLPLHYALNPYRAEYGTMPLARLIEALIDAHPHALQEKDHLGRTPADLAKGCEDLASLVSGGGTSGEDSGRARGGGEKRLQPRGMLAPSTRPV